MKLWNKATSAFLVVLNSCTQNTLKTNKHMFPKEMNTFATGFITCRNIEEENQFIILASHLCPSCTLPSKSSLSTKYFLHYQQQTLHSHCTSSSCPLTLIVRSPDAETTYLSSKSTTLTAARCPTSTLLKLMSVGDCISQTAIDRSCYKHQQTNKQSSLTIKHTEVSSIIFIHKIVCHLRTMYDFWGGS